MENQIAIYNSLFVLYAKIATATMIFPIIVAIFYWKNLVKPLKLFLYYIIAELFVAIILQLFIWAVDNYTDFLLPFLQQFKIGNTNFIGIFAYLNHFILLGLFYCCIFKNNLIVKWIRIISLLLIFISLFDYFFITGFREYSFIQATLSAIFCL